MMLTSGCGLLPWQAELGNKLPVQMPRAIISYHWPRADLDQLLCLRVDDITSCQWSGGFPLNKDQSFHIHMRYMYMYVMYVHVHVLVGPSLEWSLALCASDSAWQLELSLSLSHTPHTHTPHTTPHTHTPHTLTHTTPHTHTHTTHHTHTHTTHHTHSHTTHHTHSHTTHHTHSHTPQRDVGSLHLCQMQHYSKRSHPSRRLLRRHSLPYSIQTGEPLSDWSVAAANS